MQYYQIKSPLSQATEVSTARFLKTISTELKEEMIPVSAQQYAAADFALLYVASGGSEGFFRQIWKDVCHKPCYILTSGENNSLAAAMEILSFIRKEGGSGEILHGTPLTIAERIRSIQAIECAYSTICGARLGMIGEPSDWLISSDPDEDELLKKAGIKLIHMPIERLKTEAEKQSYIPNELTEQLLKKSFDRAETIKALYVYGALKRICEEEKLDGITVRCFDLLGPLNTTSCLGLALLNCEGIAAGCEGDVPSLLSLLIAQSVTGKGAFMCNPSRIDPAACKGVFAHCTLPVTMPDAYDTDTHFESGIGVAIRGCFNPDTFTVFKCSGDLKQWHVQVASSEPMDFDPNLCRTQIRLNLEDPYYFLKSPIGNHHILMRGNFRTAITDIMNRINRE